MSATGPGLLILLVAMGTSGSALPGNDLMMDIRSVLRQEKPHRKLTQPTALTFQPHWPKVLWGIADTTATVGRLFRYSFPIGAFYGKVWKYKVHETGQKSLPSWLYYNVSSNAIYGVPITTDQGETDITVTALGHPTTSKRSSVHVPAVTRFVIRVEANKDAWSNMKSRHGAVSLKNLQLNSGDTSARDNPCSLDESVITVTLVLDADMRKLSAKIRVASLYKMASFLSKDVRFLTLGPKKKTVDNRLLRRNVLMAGPGNVDKRSNKNGVELSWPIGCGQFQDLKDFTKVIDHNIQGGRLSHEVGLGIVGWFVVSSDPPEELKRVARIKRQAARATPVPTPTITSTPPSKVSSATKPTVVQTSLLETGSIIEHSSLPSVSSLTTSAFVTDESVFTFSSDQATSFIETQVPFSSFEPDSMSFSEFVTETITSPSDMIQPSITGPLESEPIQTSVFYSDVSGSVLLTPTVITDISQSFETSIDQSESIQPTLTLESPLQTDIPESSLIIDSPLKTEIPDSSHLIGSPLQTEIPESSQTLVTPLQTEILISSPIIDSPLQTELLESSLISDFPLETDLPDSSFPVSETPQLTFTSLLTPALDSSDLMESSVVTDGPAISSSSPSLTPSIVTSKISDILPYSSLDHATVIVDVSSDLFMSSSVSDSLSLVTPSLSVDETLAPLTSQIVETFSFFPSDIGTNIVSVVPTESAEASSVSMLSSGTASRSEMTSAPSIVSTPVLLTSRLDSVAETTSPVQQTDIFSDVVSSVDMVSSEYYSSVTSAVLTPSSAVSSFVITESQTTESVTSVLETITPSTKSMSDLSSMSDVMSSFSGLLTTSYVIMPSTPIFTDVQTKTLTSVLVTSSPLSTSTLQTSSSLSSPISTTELKSTDLSTPFTDFPTSDVVSASVLTTLVSTSALVTSSPATLTSLTSDVIKTTDVLTTPSSSVVTTPIPNKPPTLVNPLDHIVVSPGVYFSFLVPEDTFYDPEDGSTRNLSLHMLSRDGQPLSAVSWVQFNRTSQVIYGVAVGDEATSVPQDFLLEARDSAGLRVRDAFQVSFNITTLDDLSHSFKVGVNTDYEGFTSSLHNRLDLLFKISSYYGDSSPTFMTVTDVRNGSVVVEWSNNTISKDVCENQTIDYLFSFIASDNGTVNSSFASVMEPSYPIMYAYHIKRGACVEGNGTVIVLPITPAAASVSVIVIVAVVIILLILLICLLAFCVYRRRKQLSGKLLMEDEKPIFAKNRKPIYMDGEMELDDFDEKPKRPVMMLDDGNPVYDPTGDEVPSRPAPPPYQMPYDGGFGGVFDSMADNLVPPPDYAGGDLSFRPPPPYRLPPPYLERPSSSEV